MWFSVYHTGGALVGSIPSDFVLNTNTGSRDASHTGKMQLLQAANYCFKCYSVKCYSVWCITLEETLQMKVICLFRVINFDQCMSMILEFRDKIKDNSCKSWMYRLNL